MLMGFRHYFNETIQHKNNLQSFFLVGSQRCPRRIVGRETLNFTMSSEKDHFLRAHRTYQILLCQSSLLLEAS